MSRHRNIRSMNYQDEYDGYDDVYGHSVEDDSHCISPATASQFLFDRGASQHLSSFVQEAGKIVEEDENVESDEDPMQRSSSFSRPALTEAQEIQLNACLEEIRNIVGDATPEHILVDFIIQNEFNSEKAVNAVLNQQVVPKPQRVPRERDRGGRVSNRAPTNDPTSATAAGTAVAAPSTTTTLPPPASGGIQPPCAAPHIVTVITPSGEASPAVARMTFTTGDRAQSGFTPEKAGDAVSSGAPDTAKLDLNSRLNGEGEKDVNAMTNGELGEAGPMSEMAAMGLSTPKKSREGVDDFPATPKSAIKVPKKDPAVIKNEYERRKAGSKDYMNLVVIGHVDAGKSTLMGHLLYQLGFVNKKTMHKYEQESKKLGKASFAYAWVLDETEEERSRGVTMDVAQTRFETETKIVTLLDAPGHKDFIPNMITGAAQADVAVLVVNSTRGEFETGFDAGGQTREHAMLIRSLGVSQLIVAINKMDTVDWSEERFKEIKKKLGMFLKQAGFRDSDVMYVPCSGLSGENLTKPTEEAQLKAWYGSGPCVSQLIDKLKPPERQYEQPYRQCITDVFKGMGSGISVAGTLQAGSVQPGDKVLVMPQGEVANVKSVLIDEAPVQFAFAGDNATVVLTGIDMTNLSIGSILCDPSTPIKSTSRLKARVVIFNVELPITRGFPVVFHYQALSEQAAVRKLISQLHKGTGQVIKKKPRCLTKNTSAIIEVELDRPICVELYKDFKDLGRFMLRYAGSTIAAGLVTEVVDMKASKE